ncbi:hypothetical protein F4776DRAFT_654275 [Hypoxylon sp. NC0597]|nr:hypothetical protein F4776DRAFT_654275 [Hypoxylon sp. NC0597]
MAYVPVEVTVPRYGERRVAQTTMPDSEAWIVDSKMEKGRNFKLWIRPELYQDLHAIYPHLPDSEDIIRSGGFLHGRPMLEKAITIKTCGGPRRPKTLFRVIHDRQPFGGIKARGYGTVEIHPLYFQVLVQKHLNWSSRNPSPFISVTNSLEKVKIIGAVYEARGHTGIKVLEFNPHHPAWNHEEQRLWNVHELVTAFDARILRGRKFLDQEFLVENCIPPKSITKSISWEAIRSKLDPEGFSRRRMKRLISNRTTQKRKREQDDDGLEADEVARGDQENDTLEVARDEDEEEARAIKRVGAKRATDFKLRL